MRRSIVIVLGWVLLGWSPAAAHAATLVVSGGELIGATDVDVDGTLYDVEFVDSTCQILFDGCDSVSDFTFQTQAAAEAASQALLDQVFLDGGSGLFDSDPTLTAGCEDSGVCVVLTPWDFFNALNFTHANAQNSSSEASDQVSGVSFQGVSFDTTGAAIVTFAVFRAVPEPTALACLVLSIAALGSRRLRRSPSARQAEHALHR